MFTKSCSLQVPMFKIYNYLARPGFILNDFPDFLGNFHETLQVDNPLTGIFFSIKVTPVFNSN